jgi:hypothetical protein
MHKLRLEMQEHGRSVLNAAPAGFEQGYALTGALADVLLDFFVLFAGEARRLTECRG